MRHAVCSASVLVAMVAGMASASVQPGGGQSPAAAPPAVKLPEPREPGPYVTRVKREDWAMELMLRIYKNTESQTEEGSVLSYRYPLPFETMTVVFPLLPETSSSVPRLSEASGLLRLGNTEYVEGNFLAPGMTAAAGRLPLRPEILERHFSGEAYHSGVKLAKFAAGQIGKPDQTTTITFKIEVPMAAWNTEFDEASALQVPWPTGPWPASAQATFGPQQWIDFETRPDGTVQKYDDALLDGLIRGWLNGQDPRKNFTPVGLAKVLMGAIVRDIKRDGNVLNYRLERPKFIPKTDGGVASSGVIVFVGLQVRGAEYAARMRKATEWDMACLSAAVFRRCGLPTRVVVGYDKREEEEKDERKNLRSKPRAWIEFYLFDEKNNTGNWVICDPYRMARSFNTPPALEQRWKWFGDHDEMSAVMPFAFHFVPPTDVRSYGAPAFWGWMVTPAMPSQADTAITFNARNLPTPKSDKPTPYKK
jgi:hypothetical protein